jgi:hypothetical protein
MRREKSFVQACWISAAHESKRELVFLELLRESTRAILQFGLKPILWQTLLLSETSILFPCASPLSLRIAFPDLSFLSFFSYISIVTKKIQQRSYK